MPIKSVKMKISKNKKMRFFLMSQGSLNPKIRFLGQKVWPVARSQTDRHTHTHTHTQTHRVTTVGTLSGFQDFFLQPIIKDRPNNYCYINHGRQISRPIRCCLCAWYQVTIFKLRLREHNGIFVIVMLIKWYFGSLYMPE